MKARTNAVFPSPNDRRLTKKNVKMNPTDGGAVWANKLHPFDLYELKQEYHQVMDPIGGGSKPIVMYYEFLGHDNSAVETNQSPLSFCLVGLFL